MALTLVEANSMVQAAINKANELNVKVSIAVCDAGGYRRTGDTGTPHHREGTPRHQRCGTSRGG